jgi:hypothetical protein
MKGRNALNPKIYPALGGFFNKDQKKICVLADGSIPWLGTLHAVSQTLGFLGLGSSF